MSKRKHWSGTGLLLLLMGVTFYVVSLSSMSAWAHSDAITNCKGNIKYSKAKKVGVDQILSSTGLYAEHYDTNEDGTLDVVTLSHVELDKTGMGYSHRENPLFWIVDADYDGYPDAIYIDKVGNGNCKDIVLYEDLAIVPRKESKTEKGRGL